MSEISQFKDRTYQQQITEEFLRETVGVEAPDARRYVERAAKRIERSNTAVATVHTNPRGRGRAYTIKVIAKEDAAKDQIQRGLQSAYHWLAEGAGPES